MSITFQPTGIRTNFADPNAAFLDLNEGNGRALLAALGFSDVYGSCTLPEAKRALVRARNTNLSGLERATLRVVGAPAPQDDGTVELRPVRRVIGGLDQNGLRLRIAMFAELVKTAEQLGAPGISWF